MDVRLARGGVAVFTGGLTTMNGLGEILGRSRYIHVYELRNGQWQIFAAQGTQLRQ